MVEGLEESLVGDFDFHRPGEDLFSLRTVQEKVDVVPVDGDVDWAFPALEVSDFWDRDVLPAVKLSGVLEFTYWPVR